MRNKGSLRLISGGGVTGSRVGPGLFEVNEKDPDELGNANTISPTDGNDRLR